VSGDLQEIVAAIADSADLQAPVPALLLELQTMLGSLGAAVTAATDRGRRPFRPGPDWNARIGDLAYGVYLLADQTGVSIHDAVRVTSDQLRARAAQVQAAATHDWPFES
jgi:hypothetical protein